MTGSFDHSQGRFPCWQVILESNNQPGLDEIELGRRWNLLASERTLLLGFLLVNSPA
jgi:hypothetical protein